jgi:cytochrome d ubiquinol oxidase subunit I
MGLSLAFHIVYAAVGVGIPLLLFLAEGLALTTGRPEYRTLAQRWARVTGVLLAIGAVSGTILSFELGLLWPGFMRFAGGVIGMPFSLEGFAFFMEAIFLALYLFGGRVLSPVAHWLTTVPVMLGATLSAMFVISANAWMNTPAGFRLVDGRPADVHVWQAIVNPAFPTEAVHGTLASFVATSLAVAGIAALALFRGRRHDDERRRTYHWRALQLAMAVAVVAVPLQVLTGDLSARFLVTHEPEKFAALEAVYHTRTAAPLTIGGLPDPGTGEIRFGLPIPHGLSFLATGDPNARIQGLDSFPLDAVPDARLVHLPFDVMVGSGFTLTAVVILYWASLAVARWRRRASALAVHGPLLLLVAIASPLGFVALECGWLVTEFGRQPWIVHGLLRTSAAVTPHGGTSVLFVLFLVVYLALTAGLGWLLLRPWRSHDRGAAPRQAVTGTV